MATTVGLMMITTSALAERIEDVATTAAHGAVPSLFVDNPAVPSIDRMKLSAMQVTSRTKYGVTGSPGNNQSKLSYEVDQKSEGAGVLFPLGGAAVGILGQFSSGNVVAEADDRRDEFLETERRRRWQMRFVVDLLENTRAAFEYRYDASEDDVLGSFNVNDDDRTRYKGNLSGYVVGIYHDNPAFGIGAFHEPPMRGKSEIEGEQKILTEPGKVGLDLMVKTIKNAEIGIRAKRWFYKPSDLNRASTSPDDQRQISLKGIDLETWLYPTESIQVGAEYKFYDSLFFSAAIYKQSAVFLFDPEKVPRDDPAREKPVDYFGGQIAIKYETPDLSVMLGFGLASRKVDAFRDGQGSIGHRDYANYGAKDNSAFAGVSYLP